MKPIILKRELKPTSRCKEEFLQQWMDPRVFSIEVSQNKYNKRTQIER